MLRENFPCGWGVSFFGKWRVAGLKLRPSVIEGDNQNLHFLRVKDAVGKSFDKPVHRDPRLLGRRTNILITKSGIEAQFFRKIPPRAAPLTVRPNGTRAPNCFHNALS
jgi:hypothetical protein